MARRHTRHFLDYRDFDLNDNTLYGGPDDVNHKLEDPDKNGFEDSFFYWEEESTLFSDLMEDE